MVNKFPYFPHKQAINVYYSTLWYVFYLYRNSIGRNNLSWHLFPSEQHWISLSSISYFPYSKFARINALVMLVQITPEMFRNNNFVNKDGKKILFGRIHQNIGLVEQNIYFPCIREIWNLFTLEIVVFPSGVAFGKYYFSLVNKSSYITYAREMNA